jgi:CBS domain-containing protein
MDTEERKRVEAFLQEFKKLEKVLIGMANLKEDFVSFSRALNYIYYHKLSAEIANTNTYEFLKTASDVRNILAHEDNPIVPTEEFLKEFTDTAEEVMNPISCYEACTKVIRFVTPTTKVFSAIKIMEDEGLSHLPILVPNKKVEGVFSRSVFFDYLSEHKKVDVDDSFEIRDFLDVCRIGSHHNEVFPFVPRDLSVKKAFDSLMKKKSPHQKNVALLLVTEKGKEDEALLGVLTMADLAKISSSND